MDRLPDTRDKEMNTLLALALWYLLVGLFTWLLARIHVYGTRVHTALYCIAYWPMIAYALITDRDVMIE